MLMCQHDYVKESNHVQTNLSVLGPRDPFKLVLKEKAGLWGVEVAKGPLELEPNPPALPRFRLADRRTGIRLP